MRILLLSLILLITSFFGHSQTVLYSENFDGVVPWTLNVPYGTNGADPNFWQIDDDEAGVLPPGCGIAGGGNKSLHITSVFNPAGGASYDAGGLCGFFFCPETHMRAESPIISTVGQTNLTLRFDYIHNGQAGFDFGSIWINTGLGWSTLVTPIATTVICGGGQGQWTSYSVVLPLSAENNPSLQIGFGWENNDDGAGTDPSIAINNVEITTPSAGAPPVADFSTPITTICAGTCINFTNLGTYIAGATFAWNFGNTLTSSLENPINICYAAAGTYTVSLTITDANGTDTETKTNYIVVNPTVSAGADNSATVCNNTSINLNTLLSGADSGGAWTETTGTPSGQFTPATGVFNANGLSSGNYTFNYTVNALAPCPNDFATMTITVDPCTGPTAIISASTTNVCAGQSIIFNNASTGTNVDTWVWSFGSGSPGTANTPGPHSVIFPTPGTFNVWLQVSDDFGIDDTTIQITVIPCSSPTAAFAISDNTICPNDCIVYVNNTNTVGPTTYQWTFNGGAPSSSTSANPGPVCYSTPGTYTTTLVATNNFGTGTYSQNITVQSMPTITAAGSAILQPGETATITATASEGTITWSWSPNTQGDILDCTVSDCSVAEVSPVITTTFQATTTTSEGCTSSSSVIIFMEYLANIGVPNSFSPNDDGKNDVLYVKGVGITDMIFRVYNRYGQMVFESLKQSLGWDGAYKGELENSATFVYTLEYTLVDGTTGKTNGNITLIR